jgi:hypothetical protein
MIIPFNINVNRWRWRRREQPVGGPLVVEAPLERPNLSVLAANEASLPNFVRHCPVAMKYLHLLGPLDWASFPERPDDRPWPGPKPQPRAPFVAACLVKLNQGHKYMSDLRTYLVEHPALVWLLGFKLKDDPTAPHGFDVEASVPSRKQLGRVLRDLDNAALQFLLGCTIDLIRQALPPEVKFGHEISMDTKHIVAWVQQNNPKAWLKESERLDKSRQPRADRDCKLGCKKKSNQQGDKAKAPTKQPGKGHKRATQFSSDQYFWGYNSGTVTTKVPNYGEFLVAELTQTFDKGDPTFFFPLMALTEARLGFRPPFGALDAGFESWYTFEYFHDAGGFAAIPATRRSPVKRQFNEAGLPLCEAGLPQPLLSTFTNRRGLVPQPMGRYGCPLLHPAPNGQSCPVGHKKWPKGGCRLTMGTSPGARIRYQLDRKSDAYKKLYRQRSATERINSQATELGIERPKLRNQRAIANQNTLIYVLINLRAVHRLRDRVT